MSLTKMITYTCILWDIRSPQSEIVPEKLHYQGTVFVGVLVQGIQFRNCLIKSLLCKVTSPEIFFKNEIKNRVQSNYAQGDRFKFDCSKSIVLKMRIEKSGHLSGEFMISQQKTEKFKANPKRIGCVGGNSASAVVVAVYKKLEE